jgi:hypothetical protein
MESLRGLQIKLSWNLNRKKKKKKEEKAAVASHL